jgi:hypothetical protein
MSGAGVERATGDAGFCEWEPPAPATGSRATAKRGVEEPGC